MPNSFFAKYLWRMTLLANFMSLFTILFGIGYLVFGKDNLQRIQEISSTEGSIILVSIFVFFYLVFFRDLSNAKFFYSELQVIKLNDLKFRGRIIKYLILSWIIFPLSIGILVLVVYLLNWVPCPGLSQVAFLCNEVKQKTTGEDRKRQPKTERERSGRAKWNAQSEMPLHRLWNILK